MTPFFGRKKKEEGKTVLILDIENGSAASALLRLSPGEQPKLFAEMRSVAPLSFSRSGQMLVRGAEEATLRAVTNAAEVAARVRNHAGASPFGTIDQVAVFMAPPWGTPNLSDGRPAFMDSMTSFVKDRVSEAVGPAPLSFYTSAGAAAFGAKALVSEDPCLVCTVTGEISELMHLDEDGVRAHATFPSGFHSLLRTLQSHGNLSEDEARSAVRLPMDTPHVREPFAAAAREFSEQFRDAARELVSPGEVLRVTIIAPGVSAPWFAKALSSEEGLRDLFPQGGQVRALGAHHITPHIAAHAEHPDINLCLAALFVDNHVNN